MKSPMALLIGTAVLLGCGSGGTAAERPGGPEVSVSGREFTMKPGQSVRLEKTTLRLTLVAVPEDSRCHPTVVCVWAGNARLDFTLNDTPFALNTTLPSDHTVVQGYQFTLVGLSQRPPGDTNGADYLATIRVTRE
jgi:hypothetical protein